jgi:hypothetical protein
MKEGPYPPVLEKESPGALRFIPIDARCLHKLRTTANLAFAACGGQDALPPGFTNCADAVRG